MFFLKDGRSWFILTAFNDLSDYEASKTQRPVIFIVADEINSNLASLLVI